MLHHDRNMELAAGILFALVMFALAYVTAVGREDATPSPSPVVAAMRSRRGRQVIGALMALFAIVILVLHILKFVAE